MAHTREKPHDRGGADLESLTINRKMARTFGYQDDAVAAEGPAGKGRQQATLFPDAQTSKAKVTKGECRVPVA